MNIKERIQHSGVYQWEIAEVLGVNEVTICRWLRRPENLRPAVVGKIKAAITKIQAEKAVSQDEG